MEQLFNKAWREKALWLWLFLPLSWLYRFVSWANKKSYQWGLKKVYYPSVPTIVIGNITVGGSGKTPLIIALVQHLQQQGIKVGVISRGYGGDSKAMPLIVNQHSQPKQVGDEPCLIVQSTNVPMAVAPNRGLAIERLLSQFPSTQLILADDGLQHYALDRDYNWIVVDSERGFGNEQVLPVGFLREPLKRLYSPDATVIFHQPLWHTDNLPLTSSLIKNNQCFMRLVEAPIIRLLSNESNQSQTLTHKQAPKIIAMTGIGYPQRFFNSLSKLGFDVIKKPMDDHHDFQLSDFEQLPDLPIIVTTKDAVKIRLLFEKHASQTQSLLSRLWVLPVVAELSPQVLITLKAQLKQHNIIML